MEGSEHELLFLAPWRWTAGTSPLLLPTFSMKRKVCDASGAFGGPFSSPGDGRPCIIDHTTLSAMLFHLRGAADRRPVCVCAREHIYSSLN